MIIDTKSRHRTNVRGNVFLDLGFSLREAKRYWFMLTPTSLKAIRLKQRPNRRRARKLRPKLGSE